MSDDAAEPTDPSEPPQSNKGRELRSWLIDLAIGGVVAVIVVVAVNAFRG
jgi:hypothetical protein